MMLRRADRRWIAGALALLFRRQASRVRLPGRRAGGAPRLAVLLVVLLVVAGCSRAAEASSAPTAEPSSTPTTDGAQPQAPTGRPAAMAPWLEDTLWPAELERAALIARIGEPVRVDSRPQRNRHDPSITDSVVVLTYEDARFVYYVVTTARRDLLDVAEVRSNAYLRRTPPGIGTAADSLRAWWDPPIATTDSTLAYDCRTCAVPHPATFLLEDGTVRAIRFDLYVD